VRLTFRERGVIEKRVIKNRGNSVIVIRRLVWRGEECVDVRLGELRRNENESEPHIKYTTKGIRVGLEVAEGLTMALMDVLSAEREVEEAWPPVE